MTKDERLYLNDLSLKVYRTSSKWAKMVNQGEVTELIDETGRKYKGISYYSVDEVKQIMEDLWKEELEAKAKNEAEALKEKVVENG